MEPLNLDDDEIVLAIDEIIAFRRKVIAALASGAGPRDIDLTDVNKHEQASDWVTTEGGYTQQEDAIILANYNTGDVARILGRTHSAIASRRPLLQKVQRPFTKEDDRIILATPNNAEAGRMLGRKGSSVFCRRRKLDRQNPRPVDVVTTPETHSSEASEVSTRIDNDLNALLDQMNAEDDQ